jgi:ATP-dependent helicase/nuclease subunit B
MPRPSADLRKVAISATALDRLLGDPYQFYARQILGLSKLDPLEADPFGDPALRGTLVHEILDKWHKARRTQDAKPIKAFAEQYLRDKPVHPLFWGLWRPRLIAALERFEQWVDEAEAAGTEILATEIKGRMQYKGVTVHGVADRIDRLPDDTLAIIDYKSGTPPTKKEVMEGFRLQLGVLGLIARDGSFVEEGQPPISGEVSKYEFWSLRKKEGEFGEDYDPRKLTSRQKGLTPEEFLPKHEEALAHAIDAFILGDEPFTARENPNYPGYDDYDQLMRFEEWKIRLSEAGSADGEGEA